jgi:hypothetical protein
MMRAEIIYDLSSFYQNFILPRRCSAAGAYAKGASERARAAAKNAICSKIQRGHYLWL